MNLRALIIATAAILFAASAHAQSKGIAVTPAAQAAGSQRRVALVIGNGAYENAPHLRNPPNDARLMERTLRKLGFRTTLLLNANDRQMVEAIDAFGDKLRRANVGLFYYSGHGMQVKGRNYLIPVDAKLRQESDAEFETVDARRVLAAMADAGNPVNVVILDACRNNPFGRSFRSLGQGLAPMQAQGTLIAYATGADTVAADGEGRDSPYTASLARHLIEPNVSLSDVFSEVSGDVQRQSSGQQVPFIYSSLTGRVTLAGTGTTQVLAEPAPTLPSGGAFNLSDIAGAAKQQEAARRAWAANLLQMKQAAQQVESLEAQDITPDLKVAAWKRFQEAFSENDPYSTEDDALRAKAGERLTYWQRQQKQLVNPAEVSEHPAGTSHGDQESSRDDVPKWEPEVDHAVRLFGKLQKDIDELDRLRGEIAATEGTLSARRAAKSDTTNLADKLSTLRSRLDNLLDRDEDRFVRYYNLRRAIAENYTKFAQGAHYRSLSRQDQQRYYDRWKVVEYHHPRIDYMVADFMTFRSDDTKVLDARAAAMTVITHIDNWAKDPSRASD